MYIGIRARTPWPWRTQHLWQQSGKRRWWGTLWECRSMLGREAHLQQKVKQEQLMAQGRHPQEVNVTEFTDHILRWSQLTWECNFCKSKENIWWHVSCDFGTQGCCCSVTHLQPHGLQQARLPCPSPTPGVCSNSCPLSWWCPRTTSTSIAPSPHAFNLFQNQRLFQLVCSLHQVAKIWSFSFNSSPFNEYSGLISFRIDWLDLFGAVVQGTLKSLLQYHSLKLSIL